VTKKLQKQNRGQEKNKKGKRIEGKERGKRSGRKKCPLGL